MPLYRYKCDNCGEEIKIRVNVSQINEYVDMICESCGKGTMKRMISKNISSIYRGEGYTRSSKKEREVKDE